MTRPLDPRVIEGRESEAIALQFGLDLETSKLLTLKGTLQDCLNYEVVSRGYTRSQGLLRFNGTLDRAVNRAWIVESEDTGDQTLGGSEVFTIGGEVTWSKGKGIVANFSTNGIPSTTLVIINPEPGDSFVAGDDYLPSAATVFTDTTTSSTYTVVSAPTLLEDSKNGAVGGGGSSKADTVSKYLAQTIIINQAIVDANSNTWPDLKGDDTKWGGWPITGGWQFEDTIYVCMDYPGIAFDVGQNEPVLGDTVTVGSFTSLVAEVMLTSGSWANNDAAGVVFLFPGTSTSRTKDVFDAQVTDGLTFTNTTQGNTIGTTDTPNNKFKGLIWKSSSAGWALIDTGYSIRFDTGTTEPKAQIAPLFIGNDSGDDPGETYGGTTISIDEKIVTVAVETGDGGSFSSWNNLSNLFADDAAVADTTLSASGRSKFIEAHATNYLDAKDTRVSGMEIKIQVHQTSGTDAVIDSVRLVNDATGADEYQSFNLADSQALTATPTTYTFGGALDLWGFKEITDVDINSGDIKVQVRFRDAGGNARTIHVDFISIRPFYIARGETVFFYDGSSDVAQGEIYSFNVFDGAPVGIWDAGDDATGWLTLHNINNPKLVVEGLDIYTQTSGSGNLIARCTSPALKNLLPSWDDLKEENSMWRTIEANFFENDSGKSIFGCTGASPAFMFGTEDKFAFIRTPVAPDQDKPRHVAAHLNHLVLGMVSGHILVSSIGSPTVFATDNGATIHAFRNPVTGLIPISGTALGVMCRDSTNALLGTNETDFSTQNITPTTGAIEYTVAEVFGPMFTDNNGVSKLEVSEKFGNFQTGRLTDFVKKFTTDRLQRSSSSDISEKNIKVSIPVRSKNQYRMYFEDGFIMTIKMPTEEGQIPEITLSHYDTVSFGVDYVPIWIDSSILTSGRERIVMGTEDGKVWIVDGADAVVDISSTTKPDAFITINPLNYGYPQGATKTMSIQIMGDFLGSQSIAATYGKDYLDVAGVTVTKTIGDPDNPVVFDPETDYTEFFPDSLTDGFSIKFQSTLDGSQPHTLHTIISKRSNKGSGRNRTQIARG